MTTFQTDTPITPLRQRMQQDMVMRGLGSHTQNDYVRHVRNFAAFLGRPPDTATAEDIRHYQLHQHETGVGPATINSTVSALRFLFTVTLNRRDLSRTLVITRNPRKLPEVLSVEEAARLLEAAPGIKYKAALGQVDHGRARRDLFRRLRCADVELDLPDPIRIGAALPGRQNDWAIGMFEKQGHDPAADIAGASQKNDGCSNGGGSLWNIDETEGRSLRKCRNLKRDVAVVGPCLPVQDVCWCGSGGLKCRKVFTNAKTTAMPAMA